MREGGEARGSTSDPEKSAYFTEKNFLESGPPSRQREKWVFSLRKRGRIEKGSLADGIQKNIKACLAKGRRKTREAGRGMTFFLDGAPSNEKGAGLKRKTGIPSLSQKE